MIRRPPRSTQSRSSAASDVYKRQIQSAAIPPLIEGHDVFAQAATGTGKTAAFALPILNAIAAASARGVAPSALILVPTRELAMQLAEAVHKYGREMNVRVPVSYTHLTLPTIYS